ncbi:hypothetical protein ACJJWD_06335 [Comamonas testosteroni]|uniref:hypothetical protein n=1 Tax=Comamonas testosteroni TaxID=285 RepID=UPI00389A4B4E
MTQRCLLAILTTSKENRIRCQHNGCNQPVFSAIHVVLDDANLKVIGSKCFKDGYPDLQPEAELTERFGGGGRKLSAEEIERLVNNTEQLVAQLRREYELHIEEEKARLARQELERRHLEEDRLKAAQESEAQRIQLEVEAAIQRANELETFNARLAQRAAELAAIARQYGASDRREGRPTNLPASSWVNPRKSALAITLDDGSAWVRCEDLNGVHRLLPVEPKWGWEASLPTRHGAPDLASKSFVLRDVVGALHYLRTKGVQFEKVFPSFKEALDMARWNKEDPGSSQPSSPEWPFHSGKSW